MKTVNLSELIAKYDVPVPRYTSYPTVPYWTDFPTTEEWLDSVGKSLSSPNSKISIYIHIPFCETLCSFCGCNTSITKNHSVEEPYISHLLKEFHSYLQAVPEIRKRQVEEIHLGGGSPTYLSESNLDYLLDNIFKELNISPNASLSVEVDPRRTRKTQLEVMRKYGFNRISLGVQDFDEEVQRIVNRFQPFEKTKATTEDARELGYKSVNFDLIYGLPKQNMDTMKKTIEKTILLYPDRIAFYSYAHVPWIKAAQRLFTEADLPSGETKRTLYEYARKEFEKVGYNEIGMDHFAHEKDGLWKALINKTIHRNFMGYTEFRTDLLLGLGVSSISDSWECFHQNEKILKKYQKRISETGFATLRGHKLNEEDLHYRKLILELVTTLEVTIPENYEDVKNYLQEMEKDGLITWNENHLKVTEVGRAFLRNICMGLDLRMRRKLPEAKVFSQAI
ncbi:MAG: oxygen-independent coproporphyrinogen III oxidase [Leptospiraceae bacterium]|nr:oxygen-independent coproporphyrinogen III oxidase [Leptospiraceae bacterium]